MKSNILMFAVLLSVSVLSSVSMGQIVSPEKACVIKVKKWIVEGYQSDTISDLSIGPIKLKNYAGNSGYLKRAIVKVKYTEVIMEETGQQHKVKIGTRLGVIVKMNKTSCTLGSLGEIE